MFFSKKYSKNKVEEEEKPRMKLAEFCNQIAQEFEDKGQASSARYSSATLALNEGADRNTVSHLLDHENFSTIDNYAGRADYLTNLT